MLALLRIGTISVIALPGHRKVEITLLSRHSCAVAYVILESFGGFDFRELAHEVCSDVPNLENVLVAGDAQEFTPLDAPEHPRVQPGWLLPHR
jgi:non-ribosomal peptide synthetase component E (peptide arylation enzyme)